MVLAAEEKSRATHRLTTAVREWLSAEKFLSDVYASQAREDLARLPASTQVFIAKMFKSMDFDQIV